MKIRNDYNRCFMLWWSKTPEARKGSLQRGFPHKSSAWGITSAYKTMMVIWVELLCDKPHRNKWWEKEGCEHDKDIKQPDITKTFPCTCPWPWRFTKTVSNNYFLTLSRARNTSDREWRAGDFQESIFNAKNTITCSKTTDSKYLKPQQSSNAGSLRGENRLCWHNRGSFPKASCMEMAFSMQSLFLNIIIV